MQFLANIMPNDRYVAPPPYGNPRSAIEVAMYVFVFDFQ